MPVYITPQKVKMRQLSGNNSDQFYGLDVVAAETTAEQVAAINSAANSAASNINSATNTATTTINNTVNTATTNLNTAATNANTAANNLNNQVQAIATAITAAEGNGTDPTLTLSNVAADAKATGDAIGDLKSIVDNAEDDIDALETALPGKVNKPVSSPNGTNGQLLRTNGDGTTTWVDQGLPTDAQTAEAVSDWLDDHPEATTTVQDHSLTYDKLVNGTLGYVTPEMFGAVENGVCNIEKFQNMIDNGTYIKLTGDFTFPFISGSTVSSPTRIKIENKKGIVIDGDGHTVTMSELTKAYLESINDISSSGRDIFSFLAFHNCEDITVKNINFIGTNAPDANNAFRFASPRSICVAFKGCNNCYVENVNGVNILGNVVNASTADDLTTGCNKIIIANCKAQNCYENGFNIMGQSNYCIIDGCVSIRCGTGAEAYGETCVIQNCIISGARSAGIAISGGAMARNNKIIGSTGEGATIGAGISVTGASTQISKNCKVLNNHVRDCKGYGLYVYPYTENTEVKGNIFEYNNVLNTNSVANTITGTSSVKTKDLIIADNIFKSKIDDQKCFLVDNVNGVMFVNNIVEHSLPTAVYVINFSGSCENFKACGNTLTKRVNTSGTPTNYFVGNNVVGNTIPSPTTDA